MLIFFFFRKQSPLVIIVELAFLLLMVAAFGASYFPDLSIHQPFSQERPSMPVAAAEEPAPPSAVEDEVPVMLPVVPLASFVQAAAPVETPAVDLPGDLECQELIVNGGFESFTGWTLPITDRPAVYTSERAASGQRSLKLGLDTADENLASDSSAVQIVDLPADAEHIELSAQIWRGSSSEDTDVHYLTVRAGEQTLTIFHGQTDQRAWETITYELTPFRGQQVRILFGAYNTGERGKVVLYVDQVSVQACRATTPEEEEAPAGALPVEVEPLPILPVEQVEAGEAGAPTPQQPSPTPVVVQQVATARIVEPATLDSPAVRNQCREIRANRGFETNEGWVLPATTTPARYVTEQAYTGEQSLRLGIPPDEANIQSESTAYQSVQLPANLQQLTLRAQVWRSGTAGGDFHYLWISAGGQTTRVFHGIANTRAWRPVEYDLTPWTGQRILVIFGVYNDGSGGRALMYVDDLSIEGCGHEELPATPITLSTAGLPATPTVAPTATPAITPTATPASSPSPTPTSPPRLSVRRDHAPRVEMLSPDYSVNTFLWPSPEVAGRDLRLVEAAGFRWVRQKFDWTEIEPAPGEFDWQTSDRVVQQVNEQGLYLLAQLGMDPELADFWAGQPPKNIDPFTAFVSSLAERYNCTAQAVGCIQAYQIWQEPNLAREWGGNRPNPGHYLSMLKRAYEAIKAANPNAIVISAGMLPTGTNDATAMSHERFYREMYRLMNGGSQGYFDMLGVHAPGFAAPPELPPAAAAADSQYGSQRFFAFRHVEDIRNIMVANGDIQTRIAILEFGWTSDAFTADNRWFGLEGGIDEFVKADYLTRAYAYAAEHWQPWIGLMSVLTMPDVAWITDGNPFDEELYWWAIVEPGQADQARPRPAYMALCGYLNEVRGMECAYE
jgi:polysaccharide biosynthesis protein PslG